MTLAETRQRGTLDAETGTVSCAACGGVLRLPPCPLRDAGLRRDWFASRAVRKGWLRVSEQAGWRCARCRRKS